MHAGAAVAVVLASQGGDASCQDTGTASPSKECGVSTRGIHVEQGRVTDIVAVACDPKPLSHTI
jgi:hypothetical protein